MMKKSVMAAGVAALLGMSSAHAVYYFEAEADFTNATNRVVSGETAATRMGTVQAGGVGHVLFTPYFSTAQGNATMISLVNTDQNYGKVVKVRFRGAANSDDLLDFTVLLSPGDVWTGAVLSSLTGGSRILSPDTSCVLPRQIPESNPAEFREFRLDPKLSDAAKAVHRTEGYIEYLNMADISPWKGRKGAADAVSPVSGANAATLFQSIKHVDNVAPCNTAVMSWLQNDSALDKTDAKEYGLLPPTGGLFGNWSVVNNKSVTSYSGGHYASAAEGGTSARLIFAPQVGQPLPSNTDETADPLLRADALTNTGTAFNGGVAAIPALWVDLPDLSTPYTLADTSAANKLDPRARAFSLSQALSAKSLMNEFVATPDSASVPFATDWVFSQPTRRYQVAISYSSSGSNTPVNAKPTFQKGVHYFVGTANNIAGYANANDRGKVTGNVTMVQRSVSGTSLGDFLCVQAPMTGSNREEGAISTMGDFSPVPVANAAALCGETATLSFNSSTSKVLHSVLANQRVAVNVGAGGSTTVEAGWATLTLKPATAQFSTDGGSTWANPPVAGAATGLPVIGYSATSFSNGLTNGNFGGAIEHRYTR